jgi:hypothetical protein
VVVDIVLPAVLGPAKVKLALDMKRACNFDERRTGSAEGSEHHILRSRRKNVSLPISQSRSGEAPPKPYLERGFVSQENRI